jgi:hypothetical protein
MASKTPTERKCAAHSNLHRLLAEDPARRRAFEALDEHAKRFTATTPEGRQGITTIPVVVHVVFNTAADNISDAQINSQIDVLNRDYRRTNPDVGNTPAPFLPLTADARIQFQLATVDPNGSPTNGTTRTQTTVTSFPSDDSVKSAAQGGADAWPADRYLNIWVCSLGESLLGYAQFPASGPASTDGVVILNTAFGTTGTAAAPFNLGRTATHEIGHWLNLFHIWGDDDGDPAVDPCSGDDQVADTPNQAAHSTGIPAFPQVSCNNGPNGDMFMNYMDYTDDAGMFMFTAGQVLRMQATLDGARSALGTGLVSPPINPPSQTAPPYPGRLLKYPPITRGEDVRTWQSKMAERGFTITVDGLYGPQSKGVCQTFQTQQGLQVDGIVGPITWAATFAPMPVRA